MYSILEQPEKGLILVLNGNGIPAARIYVAEYETYADALAAAKEREQRLVRIVNSGAFR